MVYSTCSMNPIENESVVANLLLKFKGKLELVDSRHKLPGLKSMPGLYKWNVMTKTGEIFENAEQVSKSNFANLFKPYMFPPEESVCKELQLEKCMRILPHFQNTGGFFIAVIRKLPSPEKEKSTEGIAESVDSKPEVHDESTPPEADESRQMKCPPAKRLKHVYEENPFKFIDDNEQLLKDWPKIK